MNQEFQIDELQQVLQAMLQQWKDRKASYLDYFERIRTTPGLAAQNVAEYQRGCIDTLEAVNGTIAKMRGN